MKEQKLGKGITVLGFDSAEEMAAYIADQEAAAISSALPEQWQIGWGDWAFRMEDDLMIFGHIYTEAEYLADDPGDPDEELQYELNKLREVYPLGYRYGRWYSEVVPDGEYGSAHVSTLWQITEQEFEHARANGWQLWPELAAKVLIEMRAAHDKERKHHEEE